MEHGTPGLDQRPCVAAVLVRRVDAGVPGLLVGLFSDVDAGARRDDGPRRSGVGVSSDVSPLLDADQIRELLVELGQRLATRGIEARLFLVGGDVMALAFSRRRVTRDLDAVFEPQQEIYGEASKMAPERGLPDGWLNDGVKGLLPERQQPVEGTASFSAPGISVGVASPEYL